VIEGNSKERSTATSQVAGPVFVSYRAANSLKGEKGGEEKSGRQYAWTESAKSNMSLLAESSLQFRITSA